MRDIHDVAKGKIGFVVHQLNQFQCNAWIRYWDLEELKGFHNPDFHQIPHFQNKPLKLVYHIPHGTPVLVLSVPMVLSYSRIGEPQEWYRVLWGEMECWVRKELVINPYHQQTDVE